MGAILRPEAAGTSFRPDRTLLKRFGRTAHSARMAKSPPPVSVSPRWPHARKAFEQAEFFISHTALVGIFLVCIWAVSWLLHTLWRTTGGDPVLFDRVPLRYFFDALDAGVLLVFAVGTVRTAIVVFWFRK